VDLVCYEYGLACVIKVLTKEASLTSRSQISYRSQNTFTSVIISWSSYSIQVHYRTHLVQLT